MGSVLVRNLKTGVRRGGWDKAEVRKTIFLVDFNFSFFAQLLLFLLSNFLVD